jgi:hypothetical protein
MDRHPNGWQVGMTVYVVPPNRMGKPYVGTIEKIGRRWITFNGRGWPERFDADGMYLESDAGEPGRVWTSQAEYEESTALAKSWADLHSTIGRAYRRPDHITQQDIDDIMAKLQPPGAERGM